MGGAGSAEARRAGARRSAVSRLGGSDRRAGAEARIEGLSRECRGSGMQQWRCALIVIL